jgi:DNA polymerase III subunit alpha
LMAFLEVYDDTFEMDTVMFPQVYEQFFKSITKQMVMVIHGVLDHRNEKPQLIIEKVELL